MITSETMLVQKLEAMEALLQVSQAQSLANELRPGAAAKHPSDGNYDKLGCELRPASADEVRMVEEYAANTHASTHNQYKLRVHTVLKTARQSELGTFQTSLGNRKLLWHGSRLTNWVGILSQGLRIAPPEAPVTGDATRAQASPRALASPRAASPCVASPRLACPAPAHAALARSPACPHTASSSDRRALRPPRCVLR